MEHPFSFCGSACEPRSRLASHDGPRPAARMAVKDARCLRAAERSSAARSLTATAAKGTAPWAGATLVIMGRSRPSGCFACVQIECRAMRNLYAPNNFASPLGDASHHGQGDLCLSCTRHLSMPEMRLKLSGIGIRLLLKRL